MFGIAPTLSSPVVGTQTAGDNSTKAASTAFVATAVAAAGSSLPTPIPFNSAINLSGNVDGSNGAIFALTGPTALSVASSPAPAARGRYVATVQPNGTDVPTVPSNWTAYPGSQPWSQTNYDEIRAENTPAGVLYGFFPGAALPVAVPGQVTGLTLGATTGTTQALTWTAPSTGGTSTDYVVQFALAGSGSWTTFADGVSTATSATVTGLTPNTTYDFRVAGSDSGGPGTYSSTVTRLTAPTQVTGLAAGTPTASTIPLSWTAVPGVVDYEMQWSPAGAGTWTTFGTTPSTNSGTITGLSSGTSYDTRVRAAGATGEGAYSSIVTASTASGGGSGSIAAGSFVSDSGGSHNLTTSGAGRLHRDAEQCR